MAEEIVGGERVLHLYHDVVELGKLCGCCLFGGEPGGKPLEYLTHLQDTGRLFDTEGTHLSAAVRLNLHEALVLQPKQRRPQRRPAHPQERCDVGFDQTLAGRIDPLDDVAFELLVSGFYPTIGRTLSPMPWDVQAWLVTSCLSSSPSSVPFRLLQLTSPVVTDHLRACDVRRGRAASLWSEKKLSDNPAMQISRHHMSAWFRCQAERSIVRASYGL